MTITSQDKAEVFRVWHEEKEKPLGESSRDSPRFAEIRRDSPRFAEAHIDLRPLHPHKHRQPVPVRHRDRHATQIVREMSAGEFKCWAQSETDMLAVVQRLQALLRCGSWAVRRPC